jgi:hypothetical protein
MARRERTYSTSHLRRVGDTTLLYALGSNARANRNLAVVDAVALGLAAFGVEIVTDSPMPLLPVPSPVGIGSTIAVGALAAEEAVRATVNTLRYRRVRRELTRRHMPTEPYMFGTMFGTEKL